VRRPGLAQVQLAARCRGPTKVCQERHSCTHSQVRWSRRRHRCPSPRPAVPVRGVAAAHAAGWFACRAQPPRAQSGAANVAHKQLPLRVPTAEGTYGSAAPASPPAPTTRCRRCQSANLGPAPTVLLQLQLQLQVSGVRSGKARSAVPQRGTLHRGDA
jgi:hypothetical protein